MNKRNTVVRLGSATIAFDNSDRLNANDLSSHRAVSYQTMTSKRLSPLQGPPYFWEGIGFSLTVRPNFPADSKNGIYLKVNLPRETIEFTTIGSPVFNRGSRQDDIAICGLTYLHCVTDGQTGGALHKEAECG